VLPCHGIFPTVADLLQRREAAWQEILAAKLAPSPQGVLARRHSPLVLPLLTGLTPDWEPSRLKRDGRDGSTSKFGSNHAGERSGGRGQGKALASRELRPRERDRNAYPTAQLPFRSYGRRSRNRSDEEVNPGAGPTMRSRLRKHLQGRPRYKTLNRRVKSPTFFRFGDWRLVRAIFDKYQSPLRKPRRLSQWITFSATRKEDETLAEPTLLVGERRD